MHYASPLVDEMIAMLGAYPQLYVDIGGMQWYYPAYISTSSFASSWMPASVHA
jgi:hypothetical protein